MFPGNENRSMISVGKAPNKLNADSDELSMPPIVTKVTTGGDRVLRQSQLRGNADSFVVGSYEEMPNNHTTPI